MAMLARLEATKTPGERRNIDRRVLKLQVAGGLPHGPGIDVVVHDLSLTGLLLETWANLSVGTQIEVDLPEASNTKAKVVWSTGHYFGCQFHVPIASSVLSAAILKNPVGATGRGQAVAPAQITRTPSRSDDGEGFSLGARMRIIIALAALLWAAILLAIVLA